MISTNSINLLSLANKEDFKSRRKTISEDKDSQSDVVQNINGKVEKILKGSLDLIPSPSPYVKIQIMCGKVCLKCGGIRLLGVVNKLLKSKSLLIYRNGIESRLAF